MHAYVYIANNIASYACTVLSQLVVKWSAASMTAKVKLCSAAEWVAPVALSQQDWGWKPVQELAAW